MLIRDVVVSDLESITAIYNSIVLCSTAIYNDQPATLQDRTEWWQSHLRQGYAFLAAIEEDSLLGYATFGNFRSWPGYRLTVEGTVHIRDGGRRRGVGTQLLTELTARARQCGKHLMVAGVDSENTASLRFLERFGFEPAGRLREVGFKFARFHDLCFLQYEL